MSILLAIDPGLRDLGAAILVDGVITRAGLVRSPNKSDRNANAWNAMAEATVAWVGPVGVSTLIIEYPQAYQARFQKGDQNDLIQLACVVGAVCGRVEAYQYHSVLPRDWKGTCAKSVFTERIRGWMSDKEHAAVEECPASLRHNIYDACGLGIWYARRVGERV